MDVYKRGLDITCCAMAGPDQISIISVVRNDIKHKSVDTTRQTNGSSLAIYIV